MGEPHGEPQGHGERSVFEMWSDGIWEVQGSRERAGHTVHSGGDCVQPKGKWRLKSSLQPIQLLGKGCIGKGKWNSLSVPGGNMFS